MNRFAQHALQQARRSFFGQPAAGIGTAALASVLNPDLLTASDATSIQAGSPLHHPATAKRVIWLFMADAPSQLDLYDYKPGLANYFDKDLPESIRAGQRIRPQIRRRWRRRLFGRQIA